MLIPLALLTVLTASAAAADQPADRQHLTLAANGHTDYVIVLPKTPTRVEQTAAKELRDHLRKVTSADFQVVDEGAGQVPATKILVGRTAATQTLLKDVDTVKLGHDGIVLRTVGKTLVLTGGQPRGVLYAAYTFLEDVVGCRWWTSTESTIPHKSVLRIPQLNSVYTPPLRYREAFYRDMFHGVFAARCKCNGHFERVPPEYGGHYTVLGWCHTAFQLIPPDKYFDQHPEWFSEINGKRVRDRGQLCLTNEGVRRELTMNALKWLRATPNAGFISISQNDWGNRCQCANCRRLERAEGSPSGPLLHFVNAVAEDIEKEFPDVLVSTLAYQYTRKPPKQVRPRHNVVIRLCSIECSYSQPLESGPQNQAFRQDIEAWRQVAPQLSIWNYVTNFRNYILPHPNYRVLAPNLRYFVRNGAIGVFEQGDAGSSCGDFVQLRAWLLAHLLWDPRRDADALMTEFLNGYYGTAGPYLRKTIDLVCDAVDQSGVKLRCFMGDTKGWLPYSTVVQATRLFDSAEKAVVNNPALLARVQRARMPLDNVWIRRYKEFRREAAKTGKPFAGSPDPQAFCRQFLDRAKKFDANSFREGQSFSHYAARLEVRFAPARKPRECVGLPDSAWRDAQEGDFRLYREGAWVSVRKDPTASNGFAAVMPATHTQWAVQYPVDKELADELGTVYCYAVVRCEVRKPEGVACRLGIYDGRNKRDIVVRDLSAQLMADGRWHTVDLGARRLDHHAYAWIAPTNNPTAVSSVAVDRVFFVSADR